MRTVTTYDRLSATAQRRVVCPGCNNERTAQKTFYQTVNPFNKNTDGSVKTTQQVSQSVAAQASAWIPEGWDRWHIKCQERA